MVIAIVVTTSPDRSSKRPNKDTNQPGRPGGLVEGEGLFSESVTVVMSLLANTWSKRSTSLVSALNKRQHVICRRRKPSIETFGSQRQAAQMKRRHGYLLVMGSPLERTGMDRYQAKLPPIYQTHKGYRLVMGGQTGGVTFLAGGLNNLSVMLARFPTPEAVSEFWWSEAYREAYTIRKDSGRFSAVALPGADQEPDPIAGSKGYLVAMAAPQSPGCWRRFADPFLDGVRSRGGTVLSDSGPEAIERLESLLPGSHIIVIMFASAREAQHAWAEMDESLTELREACEPINIIALEGLHEDHEWRLNLEQEAV